ncbi:MAG TPA: hypothetical protein VMT36_08330, partial [Candidatus Saccharimonadia bacterium]|nr:hypothetical protein [Candidatus Saccharimonadia bacterium]
MTRGGNRDQATVGRGVAQAAANVLLQRRVIGVGQHVEAHPKVAWAPVAHEVQDDLPRGVVEAKGDGIPCAP